MNAPRILYLATADARGHLMRCQLLTHALRAQGALVEVLTTSTAGIAFLAEFGVAATLLSPHYAVQFDRHQNMRRGATDANVASYVFRPSRMLRDIWRLRRRVRDADLVVNDSFHPALLTMGCLPPWRRKVVHVYGTSLRQALETNFVGRVPGWVAALFAKVVAFQIDAAYARIEHHFAHDALVRGANRCYRLPTPVAVASPAPRPDAGPHAAVYLNPHFRDPELAAALEGALADAGVSADLVGEGFAGRPGWKERDARWIDSAAGSDLIISAPGMAALSAALVYRRPMVLVVTDQPEQRNNAAMLEGMALSCRIVRWEGDGLEFRAALRRACRALQDAAHGAAAPRTSMSAADRLQVCVELLVELARQGRRTA